MADASTAGGGVDTRAATVTVGPDHADFPLTQAGLLAAIAALPAAGGKVYIGQGTLALAATVSLPDKPVEVEGAGRDATVVDIGAAAIAAFTMPFARAYTFRNLTIKGDGSAGQIAFKHTLGVTNEEPLLLDNVQVGSADAASGLVEVILSIVGNLDNILMRDCDFASPAVAAARTIAGGGRLFARRVRHRGRGGFSTTITFECLDCDFQVENGMTIGSNSFIEDSRLDSSAAPAVAATVSGSRVRLKGNRFTTVRLVIAATGADCAVVANHFFTGADRDIDVLAQRARIVGNRFEVFGLEAVRMSQAAPQSPSDCVVVGNHNCIVTETASADGNLYGDNQGFDTSTIIGATSVVMDWNTRAVAASITLDRNHRTVLVDAAAAARTITLPTAAAGRYQTYAVKKTDSSANTVTIDASGAETIDGGLTVVLDTQFDAAYFQSDGTTWRIIALYKAQSLSFEWDADPATNPSRVSNTQVWGYELPDGSTKGVVTTFDLPKNTGLVVSPVVRIPYFVSVLGAASANVRMRLTARYIADGELTSKAADETLLQTVAVTNTLNRMDEMSFTLNAALLAQSDKVNLHLERLGADGADTFTGAIAIVEDAGRMDYVKR